MATKLSISLARRLTTLSKSRNMDQSTLILTQIIFRHGHRSPISNFRYPGDPHENEQYLPFGKGELTSIGRKQCFAFGQALRTRYGKFLGPDYHEGIIDAKSSEISRARTTLQLVLAGLFPPTQTTQVHDQLNWQPIPFTYLPIEQDKLIGRAVCNMSNHEDHPEFRKSANSQEVLRCFEEKLQWNVQSQVQCLMLYDVLKTQIECGLAMPEWCADIYPEKLRKEFADLAQHNFGRKKFLIDGHGDLIREMHDVMNRRVDEMALRNERAIGTAPKIYLYSAHDINIAGVLSVFKRFDAAKWPNYMSNITIELHHVGGEFFVKMLYQDGPDDARDFREERKLTVLKLPNADDEVCRLREFNEYVREYFPEPIAPEL